jgi:hypothetical protein
VVPPPALPATVQEIFMHDRYRAIAFWRCFGLRYRSQQKQKPLAARTASLRDAMRNSC